MRLPGEGIGVPYPTFGGGLTPRRLSGPPSAEGWSAGGGEAPLAAGLRAGEHRLSGVQASPTFIPLRRRIPGGRTYGYERPRGLLVEGSSCDGGRRLRGWRALRPGR